MQIRPYTPADRERCLKLFDSNAPLYFDGADRPQYETFLDSLPGPYLVFEAAESIVACGGWARDRNDSSAAILCWGIVDARHHARGVGRKLLLARMEQIASAGICTVTLNTTPEVQAFFEKFGFVERERVASGYGPRFDRVAMIYTRSLS